MGLGCCPRDFADPDVHDSAMSGEGERDRDLSWDRSFPGMSRVGQQLQGLNSTRYGQTLQPRPLEDPLHPLGNGEDLVQFCQDFYSSHPPANSQHCLGPLGPPTAAPRCCWPRSLCCTCWGGTAHGQRHSWSWSWAIYKSETPGVPGEHKGVSWFERQVKTFLETVVVL